MSVGASDRHHHTKAPKKSNPCSDSLVYVGLGRLVRKHKLQGSSQAVQRTLAKAQEITSFCAFIILYKPENQRQNHILRGKWSWALTFFCQPKYWTGRKFDLHTWENYVIRTYSKYFNINMHNIVCIATKIQSMVCRKQERDIRLQSGRDSKTWRDC